MRFLGQSLAPLQCSETFCEGIASEAYEQREHKLQCLYHFKGKRDWCPE